ncbi:hypothetical protein CVT26_004683 [Gymnopilus dilepis]|uniref:Uncharacterized protein n=1 Tax=Gymnopilus dilepis TaxID=231916 RepID=A0A409XZ40_9AGAR|nr:hypothetical protein CVT26_004683 [Gymnopilus dilepis]
MLSLERPMQLLPPETLGEIFCHCLPPDALDHQQPDVKTGPMLLSQVCSHWRGVAFATPYLWQSLHHVLRVSPALLPSTMLLGGGIDKRDLDFLKWWKEKLGGLRPKLRLGIRWVESKDFQTDGTLDDFLLSLLSSARHLDLDRGLACMAREYFRHRSSKSTFKHSTLIIRSASSGFRQVMRIFPKETLYFPAVSPVSSTSTLRRLFLDSIMITESDIMSIGWAHLTHAILMNVVISNRAWVNLIQECVNLELGVFHLGGYKEPGGAPDPPLTELPKLRRLVVKWNPLDFGESVFIFKNLVFPNLTALRLESVLSVGALHEILDSTPSLEELHLSYRIPKDPNDHSSAGWIPGPESNMKSDPLSAHAPNLRRLILQVNLTWNCEYKDFNRLVDVIMCSPWLGLGTKGSLITDVALTADYSGTREILMKNFNRSDSKEHKVWLGDESRGQEHGQGVRIRALKDSPWWMDGDLAGQYVMDPFNYSGFLGDAIL